MIHIPEVLDSLHLDWSDLPETHRLTSEFLQDLAADRAALRRLIERARADPVLRSMCERHRLLDKIVLYDAGQRGLRLRLHISTSEHLDRPHDHRFSFTSRILTGGYRHIHHEIAGLIDSSIPSDVQEADRAQAGGIRVVPRFTVYQRPGTTYTLHHSQIHTTVTSPDTVSLFLRGPAEKERSIITERDTGLLWWRYGAEDESPERRSRKLMSDVDFDCLAERLEALQVV